MAYSVKAGGKRLRPLLIKEAFLLCGGDERLNIHVDDFCAAIEYIHTYSLVHDDLPAMDNDLFRRGMPTTHSKYGEDFGILAGDALLNYAYETVLKTCEEVASKYPEYANRFISASKVLADNAGVYGMVGGQALDVYKTGSSVTKEELDFIFELKTGALIKAAFHIGAILAGASESEQRDICDAGDYVGLAFQIRDDILDETGDEEEIGKPVHSDQENEKTTYVTLYGLEKSQKDVESYSEKAISIIKSLGDNIFLIELIRYMIGRSK